MKVLVVDDSAIMRRAVSKIAQKIGFESIEAENGAECLVKLRSNLRDVAIIVLDWNMPVMDGYEVLVKIRANEEYCHVPVLMATSDGVQEDVMKAIKAGADSYLVKPYSPTELANRIKEVIHKRSQMQH